MPWVLTLWPLKFFLVWRNSHRLHINNATWHVQHIFWEDIKTATVKLKTIPEIGRQGHCSAPLLHANEKKWICIIMNDMTWTTYLLEKNKFQLWYGFWMQNDEGLKVRYIKIRLKLSIDPDFKCEIAKGLVTT